MKAIQWAQHGVERRELLRTLEIVIEGLEQELRALGDELDVELLAFADLGLDVLAPPLGPLRQPGGGEEGAHRPPDRPSTAPRLRATVAQAP